MIKRTLQHKIDTKAIRKIFTQLDENWLVRNLDERDYGIDLTLERFTDEDATGDFIFVQVKGTQSEFNTNISLSGFPTKTIEYSLLFDVPFFVFYTSLKSNQTKFIWLQKYVNLKLENTTTQWQEQDTVTLYFPIANDLENNIDKITNIIRQEKSKKYGVEYLSLLEQLKLHSGSVQVKQYAVSKYCMELIDKIKKLDLFIQMYSEYFGTSSNYSYKDIDLELLANTYNDILKSELITSTQTDVIELQLKLLEMVKVEFLQSDIMEEIIFEISGEQEVAY